MADGIFLPDGTFQPFDSVELSTEEPMTNYTAPH